MSKNRDKDRQKKYTNVIANFSGLALENRDKEKCLLTLTGNKETYKETALLREKLIQKINSLKKYKYKDSYFKYYAVVEFGKNINNNFNPHLHVQCYYEDIKLVQEAYQYIIKKFNLDISRCDLSISKKKNQNFYYVIKNFLPSNYDPQLEALKDITYKGEVMVWSSRKSIPNYLIKRLYQYLSKLPKWKDYKFKYELILEMIADGRLSIQKIKNKLHKGYKQVKNWCFKVINKKVDLPKTHPYKIKNTKVHEETVKKKTNANLLIQFFFLLLIFIKTRITIVHDIPDYSKSSIKSSTEIIFYQNECEDKSLNTKTHYNINGLAMKIDVRICSP